MIETNPGNDFFARVLADSISTEGVRLTTLELTFSRFILAEVNTHRILSRNSASSRAIPVRKQLEKIRNHPFVPGSWPTEQKGMQGGEPLDEEDAALARDQWLEARDNAVDAAEVMLSTRVHKSIVNRLLEPFMWHTAIVSATDWRNFFALRTHKDAQPEFKRIADMALAQMQASVPEELGTGQWHLPLIFPEDREGEQNPLILNRLMKISVGRCARVSYLTHDGVRDHDADIALADRLQSSGHMSPFEHVATPVHDGNRHIDLGNFQGWVQFRKLLPNEAVFQA